MYISILEVIYNVFHVFYREGAKTNSQRALEDSVPVYYVCLNESDYFKKPCPSLFFTLVYWEQRFVMHARIRWIKDEGLGLHQSESLL